MLMCIKHKQIIGHSLTCLLEENMRKKKYPTIYIYEYIWVSERLIENSDHSYLT